MTRQEFKAARKSLGHSQAGLAKLWGMGAHGGRNVRAWELGESPLNPIAAYCMALMLKLEGK